jgi:hypothetical protein
LNLFGSYNKSYLAKGEEGCTTHPHIRFRQPPKHSGIKSRGWHQLLRIPSDKAVSQSCGSFSFSRFTVSICMLSRTFWVTSIRAGCDRSFYMWLSSLHSIPGATCSTPARTTAATLAARGACRSPRQYETQGSSAAIPSNHRLDAFQLATGSPSTRRWALGSWALRSKAGPREHRREIGRLFRTCPGLECQRMRVLHTS